MIDNSAGEEQESFRSQILPDRGQSVAVVFGAHTVDLGNVGLARAWLRRNRPYEVLEPGFATYRALLKELASETLFTASPLSR